jgi:hypothetical protein
MICRAATGHDPERVYTTVRFQAPQLNDAKKQFVATRKLPFAVIHRQLK